MAATQSHIDVTIDRPRRIKYTMKTARQLEAAARALNGSGIAALMAGAQIPDVIALLTCYGIKHEDPKMNESKAEDIVQIFIDNGGDVEDLYDKLTDALIASGLYKKKAAEAAPDENPS